MAVLFYFLHIDGQTNIFEQSLIEIWATSPVLKRLRDRSNLECVGCDLLQLCGGCRGIAHVLTGNLYARDPHCFLDMSEDS